MEQVECVSKVRPHGLCLLVKNTNPTNSYIDYYWSLLIIIDHYWLLLIIIDYYYWLLNISHNFWVAKLFLSTIFNYLEGLTLCQIMATPPNTCLTSSIDKRPQSKYSQNPPSANCWFADVAKAASREPGAIIFETLYIWSCSGRYPTNIH